MAFTNNVMIVRHGLLAKLVKLWKENRRPLLCAQGTGCVEVQDIAAARIRYAGRGRRADPFV